MNLSRSARWFGVALVVMAAGLGPGHPRADEAKLPHAVLTKAYSVTLGQAVAGTISTLLATLKPIDSPMMAVCDGDKIEIWIFGGRGSADGARSTLEEFQQKASPVIAGIVGSIYGVELADDQMTLVYMNRFDSNKEIMRREDGKYLVK